MRFGGGFSWPWHWQLAVAVAPLGGRVVATTLRWPVIAGKAPRPLGSPCGKTAPRRRNGGMGDHAKARKACVDVSSASYPT